MPVSSLQKIPGKMKASLLVELVQLLILFPLVFGKSEESLLTQKLFEDYDRFSRPVSNPNDTITVNLSVSLNQIIHVEEKRHLISVNILVHAHWDDIALTWDPSKNSNISQLRIPTKQVWSPDISLYNSAENQASLINSNPELTSIVFHNGIVLVVPSLTLTTICLMDVTWFPFDDQVCTLDFGSWTFDGKQVDFVLGKDRAIMTAYTENSEWELTKAPFERLIIFYEEGGNVPYIKLKLSMHIRRRRLYYFFSLVVPCGLIGFLALLGFTLPPDSGEKLTLGVTVLFSLITFLGAISTTMPANSYGIPLLGSYFTCVMLTIAMSVVSTIVVNLNKKNLLPPKAIESLTMRLLLFRWLPKLLFMNVPISLLEKGRTAKLEPLFETMLKEVIVEQWNEKEKKVPQLEGSPRSRHFSAEEINLQWKFIALLVNRVCLLVSLIVMVGTALALLLKKGLEK